MPEVKLPPSGLAEDVLGGIGVEEHGELHLVTFNLGEEYGVPIGQVQEIIRVGRVTMVPNAPEYMEGVINLRGKVLPVLNLRRKLRLSYEGHTKKSRIVVTEVRGKTLGLLVDSVSHVIKVPGETVEEAPDEVLDVDTDYITGVCKLKERLIILIDLDRLLRKEKIELPGMEGGG